MHRKAPITDKSRPLVATSFKRDILVMLDRHRAVFLNDLLPPDRTNAQYQMLCRAARMLEEAKEIETFHYLSRSGKPGNVVLVKPGYEVESPDKVPRLKPEEWLRPGAAAITWPAAVRADRRALARRCRGAFDSLDTMRPMSPLAGGHLDSTTSIAPTAVPIITDNGTVGPVDLAETPINTASEISASTPVNGTVWGAARI